MLRRILSSVLLGLLVFACSEDIFVTGDAAPDAPLIEDGGAWDTGALDVSVGDAGTDAPTCDGTSFCAMLTTDPTFCADFDEQTNPAAGWSGGMSTTGGYTLVREQQRFTSCPAGVKVTIPPLGDAGTNPGAAELFEAPVLTGTDGGLAYTQWTLEFDLWAPQASNGQNFRLGRIHTAVGEFGLTYNSIGPSVTGWVFEAAGSYLGVSLPTNQWVHVTIYVYMHYPATGGYTASLTIGTNAYLFQLKYFYNSTATAQAIIGISTENNASGNAPPGSFYYDNVVMRLAP